MTQTNILKTFQRQIFEIPLFVLFRFPNLVQAAHSHFEVTYLSQSIVTVLFQVQIKTQLSITLKPWFRLWLLAHYDWPITISNIDESSKILKFWRKFWYVNIFLGEVTFLNWDALRLNSIVHLILLFRLELLRFPILIDQ